MIYAERSPASRATVYTVRCDSCKKHEQVTVNDRIDDDRTPSRAELHRATGFTLVLGNDTCNACYADAKPAISSSWDVRDGEVSETTTTVLSESAWATIVLPAMQRGMELLLEDAAIEAIEQLGPGRLRAAMAGMANVMRGVVDVFVRIEVLVNDYAMLQQEDSYMHHLRHNRYAQPSFEKGSEEWSRRVREGVARIKPPGPQVCCQSEEDE